MKRSIQIQSGANSLSGVLTQFREQPTSVVVFCHGLGSFIGNSFALSAEQFIEAHNLVDATLRFGFHEHFEGVTDLRNFSFETAQQDLLEAVDFVRKFGDPKITVVASSFGAQVLLAAMVDGLVVHQAFLRAALADFMHHRMSFVPSEHMRAWNECGWFEFPVAGRIAKLNVRLIEELSNARSRADYARIPGGIPITFFHGSEDQTIPCSITRAEAAKIPHSVFHEVAGADHSFSNEKHQNEMFAMMEREWRR